MKAAMIVLLAISLQAYARPKSQEITLSLNNAKLETVFKEIQKQTSYRFVYTKEQLEISQNVNLEVKKVNLETVLQLCFRDQPLGFTIEERYIIIYLKGKNSENRNLPEVIEITGRVINEQGESLPGATVSIKGTNKATATNENGAFNLQNAEPNAILIISSIGYQTQEISVKGRTNITVQLKIVVSSLDETVVIAYGTTTKRLNTGSVGRITADDISKQPVSNPLAALSGRVPGLLVSQSSGVPGSSFKIEIRGRNSIAQGNNPLFIIDGVPFASGNNNINQVGAAFTFNGNGLSPFNIINPADIESIEILKDADATAIYGSRGANGVVLITTKKAKAGKTKFDFNIYSGISRVTRTMDLLNTQQYVQMRKEAFFNDGVVPTASNAYDILVWDTTRYTDLKKMLIGGTANVINTQASVSGGDENTRFLIGTGYQRETTVYPGDMVNSKGSLHFNIKHQTIDKKLSIVLTGFASEDKNNIAGNDLTNFANLAPNLPPLFDANGKLNWSGNGYSFSNPLSYLQVNYDATTDNLLSNLQLTYRVTKNLTFKNSFGYNKITVSEIRTRPAAAQNPANNPTGSSQFGNSEYKTLIAEPQLEYSASIKKVKLQMLIGGTWQQNTTDASYMLASGYNNDALLKTSSGAASISTSVDYRQYRYAALFSRMNLNLANRYILNMNVRRDGSSRFGPGRQYANFGSVGGAWIFSNEAILKKLRSVISFGKLRISYGSSGNDNIGDYQYLDTYSTTSYPYQGSPGLYPSGLFNSDYGWEINRKAEAALELGLINDRILLTIAYFRNRCGNQLVPYNLPSQTGFTSIIKNLSALVQNTGYEFEVSSTNIKTEHFTWATWLNVTMPENKLISYPELEASSNRNKFVVGQPLNIGNGFQLTGVNPQTGIYEFLNSNGNAVTSPAYPNDYVKAIAKLDPDFYGAIRNSFGYKNLQLDVFFEFRKQTGSSYLQDLNQAPGIMRNQPTIVLDRWQRPGDKTSIQRYTTSTNNPAYLANSAISTYGASNVYTDASFLRLKNISFSYSVPFSKFTKLSSGNFRAYVQGQNLFVLTNYKGTDPETQNFFYLPPLRTITAGIQITF